jgi:glycosyltransferase involved in cell wall biosynthesis
MRVLHVMGKSLGGIRQHVASLHGELVQRDVESLIAGPFDVMRGLAPQDVAFDVPRVTKPLSIIRSVRAIRRASADCDVIHAHGITAGQLALWSQRGRKAKPVVVTLHNIVDPFVAGRKYRYMRAIEKRIIKKADHIICPSAFALAHLVDVNEYETKSTVILPVGREVSIKARELAKEQAPLVRKSFGIDDDVPLAVCVARYDPQKDLPTLIEAFSMVVKENPRARLFIAGTGTDSHRSAIQKHIDSLKMNHAISLIGYVDQPDALMACAQLMVLSSRYETVPLVLLESLQLGTPVVMTEVGIASEILDGSCGTYVPVGDSQAMATAIQTWFDPAKQNTIDTTSRELRANEFVDRDTCVAPIITIYEQLCSIKGSH